MVDAIRGTVNGTVMVAVAEGLLIGIAYLLAGVPNPMLFTVLTIGVRDAAVRRLGGVHRRGADPAGRRRQRACGVRGVRLGRRW